MSEFINVNDLVFNTKYIKYANINKNNCFLILKNTEHSTSIDRIGFSNSTDKDQRINLDKDECRIIRNYFKALNNHSQSKIDKVKQ